MIKRQGREVDHSSQSSANIISGTFFSTLFQDMHSGNFTLAYKEYFLVQLDRSAYRAEPTYGITKHIQY